MQPKTTQSQMAISVHTSQPGNLISSQSLVAGKMTTSQSTVDNTTKPPLTLGLQLNSETTQDNSSNKHEQLPLLKTGSAFIGGVPQMGLTGMTSYTHQNLMLEQTPIMSNPLSTNGFSSIDQREGKAVDYELL